MDVQGFLFGGSGWDVEFPVSSDLSTCSETKFKSQTFADSLCAAPQQFLSLAYILVDCTFLWQIGGITFVILHLDPPWALSTLANLTTILSIQALHGGQLFGSLATNCNVV